MQSITLAGLLCAAPVSVLTGSAVTAQHEMRSSALAEFTPIVDDMVIFIVCEYQMDHIWIFNNMGQLVAEAAGDLGYSHQFDFAGMPSGIYTVTASTDAGAQTSRFFY